MYGCIGPRKLVNFQDWEQCDRKVDFPKIMYICTETSGLK